MKRLLIAAAALLALLSSSCLDAEPSEISIISRRGGRPHNVTVMIFKDGKQVNETSTSGSAAQVYIKNLAPGNYLLKFKDHSGNMFPAERAVNIRGGDQVTLNVELDDTSENPAAEGAAS